MKKRMAMVALLCAGQVFAGTIQVEGSAERMVDPDTVVCSFDVSALHKEAEKAATEFATRQNAVISGLSAAGFTTNEVVMNAVSMVPKFEHGSFTGRSLKGFCYAATHQVKFAFDRARLTKLYKALSGGAFVERFDVDFTCQDSAAVMQELRQEAVVDAVQKADEYAKGFGVVVKGLDCVRESADLHPAYTTAAVRYLAAIDIKNGALAPDFERLTPQQIKFECSVSASFKVESK